MSREELRKQVEDLAREHFEIAPDVVAIYWLAPAGEGGRDEVRLLELTEDSPRTGEVFWLSFAPTKSLPIRLQIAELNPEDWEAVEEGRIPLPEGWSLERIEDAAELLVDKAELVVHAREVRAQLGLVGLASLGQVGLVAVPIPVGLLGQIVFP